jgi:hypothetical protein
MNEQGNKGAIRGETSAEKIIKNDTSAYTQDGRSLRSIGISISNSSSSP